MRTHARTRNAAQNAAQNIGQNIGQTRAAAATAHKMLLLAALCFATFCMLAEAISLIR